MSIFKISKKASSVRKKSPFWRFILVVSFVLPIYLSFKFDLLTASSFHEIIEMLLALNGTILGLAIAGFSISNVIPKETMAFMASNESKKYGCSHFRVVLDNYAICFVTLFSSLFLYLIFYFVGLIPWSSIFEKDQVSLLLSISIGSIVLIQTWVMIELKIFLFWIYDNSLMIAQSVTMNEGLVPFDKEDD